MIVELTEGVVEQSPEAGIVRDVEIHSIVLRESGSPTRFRRFVELFRPRVQNRAQRGGIRPPSQSIPVVSPLQGVATR